MKMPFSRLFQALMSLVVTLPLHAAGVCQNLLFHDLNMSHGISDNYVRDITRDSWGMMWLVTLNGINSYNGYHFRRYTIDNNRHWNDAIYNVYESADSILWITGALDTYIYHRDMDSFDGNILPQLSRYNIKCKPERIVIDNDRNLWAWRGQQLVKYDFARRKLMDYTIPHGRRMVNMACRHGRAWLLLADKSRQNSANVEGELWHIENSQQPIFAARTGFSASEQSRIYIDTTGRPLYYDIHSFHLLAFNQFPSSWTDIARQPSMSGKMITTVMDDDMGNLWIGTDNHGMTVIDRNSYNIVSMRSDDSERFSPYYNHIVCFYKDDENSTIWIGTSKQGVVFANLNQMPVCIVRMPKGEDVSCISEDSSNRLWLGFDSQGIGVCPVDNIAVMKRVADGIDNMISNQMTSTFTDSRGRQWWGSYGGRLFYIHDGKPTYIDNDNLRYVMAFAEINDGMMWFATWDRGLVAMTSDGRFYFYCMRNTIMNTDNMTDIAFDGKRTMYVGTSNGLYALDLATRQMRLLRHDHVKALCIDKRQHCLWIGLRDGLVCHNLTNGKERILTTHDGMSHNQVLGLCTDHYGNLWASTSNGITHITVSNGIVRATPFYSEDGIGNVRFNNHAIACLSNGDIIVGGIGFMARITPQQNYNQNKANNPVRFTGLSVNGEDIFVDSTNADGYRILSQNILDTHRLRLHAADRNICLEVSSMDYANLHKTRYVYRLHDNERWIPIESNIIQLNSLEAGTYQLAVKVAEPDGIEHNPQSVMEIVVVPHIYASWQAYMLYIAVALCAAVVIVKRYRRRMARREQHRRREERLLQKQKMDEAKLEFFTQVSHDIRTPLSLVITPLERLVRMPIASELKLQLELVLRNAQTLFQETTKILDIRNLDDILWIKQNTDNADTYKPIYVHNSMSGDNKPSDSSDELPHDRKTILIVEDTDDFRMFLHSCLVDYYDVIDAANGREALEIIEKQNRHVDLILSDIMMPVMNGMELCNHIKNDIRLSHIPFIMLTARTSDDQMLSGLREGADDYITKPFNLDILLLRIQRLLKWTDNAGERLRKLEVSPSDITVSNIDKELIAHAIALVEQNMDNPEYSIEQFCEQMSMSRSSLYKKLVAITGMSPIRFVRTLRVKRGRQLLEESGESISQVAYKVGLSPKQFAKYFKEEYGISPSEMKRS